MFPDEHESSRANQSAAGSQRSPAQPGGAERTGPASGLHPAPPEPGSQPAAPQSPPQPAAGEFQHRGARTPGGRQRLTLPCVPAAERRVSHAKHDVPPRLRPTAGPLHARGGASDAEPVEAADAR